jgi:threonine dehydrogenase-like Zn-dependent dehydrogenase
LPAPAAPTFTIPATQHAIQIVGPGRIVHNRAKPVPVPGPTQILLRVESASICFSDTKLLKAFTHHLRKAEVSAGMDAVTLAEIPSYVPGDLPTVPGHEVAARIVAVGPAVAHHEVGERVLVQADYRHLLTPGSNAAFGYNFEGGLQEYVLLDERMLLEPGTGERYLIPVGEEPGRSAVGLLEPWACVERSYATRERQGLAPGGRLLVVTEPGRVADGLDALLAAATPGETVTVAADVAGTLPAGPFDDIVYFGADADRIEALGDLLGTSGVLDVVCGGGSIGRPVSVDVGRVHYDLTRWVGTAGTSAADGYAMIPPDGELRAGDSVAVIGAAGPMGFMHVIRTASSGLPGLRLCGIDIDDARLAHLAEVAGPLAASHGVAATFANSRVTQAEPGFSYVAVMVPAPALVVSAVELAGDGARVNIFAGFAAGTRAALDLDAIIARRIYLFGTSGSEIADMKAVLAKLERGELDTNVSVDAVTGMEGVGEALAQVEARTSGGKIVVYPQLHEMGLFRLADLDERFPQVAAALDHGRWTREAETALLAEAALAAEGSAEASASAAGASAASAAGGPGAPQGSAE